MTVIQQAETLQRVNRLYCATICNDFAIAIKHLISLCFIYTLGKFWQIYRTERNDRKTSNLHIILNAKIGKRALWCGVLGF